ncbi:Fe(3+)-hydroxamate ABC transporter permease FhuB [Photobacterium frigidiphilum]|uniref:Fe(3+)-hydroxamate ABC transporter permease FhuB n=1 Tax=Photobacterium frigidiphilum TaxID=264736 RepID=UPI003D14A5A7
MMNVRLAVWGVIKNRSMLNWRVMCHSHAIVTLFLICLFVWLFHRSAPYSLSMAQWVNATLQPDPTDYQQIIIHYTYLPRIVMALICGAGLAMAGCVMQHVLRNPLASPTTLGVAAGAELGLVCGILFVPAALGISNYWFAFAGGLVATGLVFVLTAKKGFAPLQMVLSGMVVSLFFGALNMMLLLLNEEQLNSVFIWGAGALNQNDWQGVLQLLPLVVTPFIVLLLLQRPLSALQLGEEVAKSVGVKVAYLRLATLIIAVFMTSSIISQVGIIGFVGLVSPALATLSGVRHFFPRMLMSSLIGAMLLLGADLLIQPLSGVGGELLPTGAITALIGAPFLLWLLHRHSFIASQKTEQEALLEYQPRSFRGVFIGMVLVSMLVIYLALCVGNSTNGWVFLNSSGSAQIDTVLALRFPRVAVAMLAGVALALSGTVIQRMTGNPMASPEVMGISAGAAFALVLGAMSGIAISRSEQMLLGVVGSMVVMGCIWLSGRNNNFAPTQMLLTGIALSAFLDAMIRIALSTGQDNVKALLSWLSGSTYLAGSNDAGLLLIGILSIGCLLLLWHRWLDIMALGSTVAESIGVNCRKVRQLLMLAAASLTALATMVVGPLSFVGLLAPHMAKSLGQYNARHQLVIACLLGGNIMVFADWVGRNVWFPWQFPAGLLASIIGGGYFLYLLRK